MTLLNASGPEWRRAAPASAGAVEQLNSAFDSLPAEYIQLLHETNGGEGELGVEPGWFQLWPAEEVSRLNAGYQVRAALPGWIGIGSNGGGELLALDPSGRVCMVPFIPLSVDDAVCIAQDIPALVQQFGRREDAA
jgi:hypothetical protein